MTRNASIGSVSHGTMLASDLIRTFSDELTYLLSGEELPDVLNDAEAWLELDESERDEEQGQLILDELFNRLGDLAPAHCHFGAHEGDGSDYGFWPCQDSLDELPKVSDSSELDSLDESDTEAVVVNDHGNMALYAKGEDGQWSMVWDCV